MEQKLRKGEWLPKAPYDYIHIKKPDGTKDIIIDGYAAAIVKKAFELYATGTFFNDSLRKKLKNDFRVNWIKSYIDKILKNHFNYGIMRVKGKDYPHRYPPIITQALFNQVQQVKDSFNKKPVKYADRPYIHHGLIRCGDCGLSITPEQHKGLLLLYPIQWKTWCKMATGRSNH